MTKQQKYKFQNSQLFSDKILYTTISISSLNFYWENVGRVNEIMGLNKKKMQKTIIPRSHHYRHEMIVYDVYVGTKDLRSVPQHTA